VLKTMSIGIVATFGYRIANFFYYLSNNINLQTQSVLFMENIKALTTIDIHPAAKIGKQFFIDHGANVVVGQTTEIGERCTLFNGVILGSKNVVGVGVGGKRHPTLKNDVTVCANAKLLGNITIGENVFISPGAVVLDDIEDNAQVLIVNQLQIEKNNRNTYLPSQKLMIYGIVPKFKNSIHILGEGIYNPTVLIKLKSEKELKYEITYWDKNKIIVKFKNTTPMQLKDLQGLKTIVLSNSNKVVVLNSAGVTRALTTLNN